MAPVVAAAFASGSGSNVQALLDAEAAGAAYRIRLLVSDREGIGAIERARRRGVATRVVPVSGRDASDVEADTLAALREADVDVVLLAGYLKLIPGGVVETYRGRILNVHPALLPSFGGKGMYGRRVHEAVLASGCAVSGPTVHLADERYDEGAVIAQWPVPVLAGDGPESLAARVLHVEHRLYPLAAHHASRCLARGEPITPLRFAGAAWALSRTASPASIQTLYDETFPTP